MSYFSNSKHLSGHLWFYCDDLAELILFLFYCIRLLFHHLLLLLPGMCLPGLVGYLRIQDTGNGCLWCILASLLQILLVAFVKHRIPRGLVKHDFRMWKIKYLVNRGMELPLFGLLLCCLRNAILILNTNLSPKLLMCYQNILLKISSI